MRLINNRDPDRLNCHSRRSDPVAGGGAAAVTVAWRAGFIVRTCDRPDCLQELTGQEELPWVS